LLVCKPSKRLWGSGGKDEARVVTGRHLMCVTLHDKSLVKVAFAGASSVEDGVSNTRLSGLCIAG